MQGILVFLDFTINPTVIKMFFGLLIALVLTIVIIGILAYLSSKKPHVVFDIALIIIVCAFFLYVGLFLLSADLIETHDLFIVKATPDILVARVSAITFNGCLLVGILYSINETLIKKTEKKKIGKTLSVVGGILLALGGVFFLLNHLVPYIYDTVNAYPSLAIGIGAVVLGGILALIFAVFGKREKKE